jgi:hypothetical protein
LKIDLFAFVQFSSHFLFDWYVAVLPPKKELKVPFSRQDTTVCSLMCGPLAIVGALTHIGLKQKWLYIGHSEDFFKDYVW